MAWRRSSVRSRSAPLRFPYDEDPRRTRPRPRAPHRTQKRRISVPSSRASRNPSSTSSVRGLAGARFLDIFAGTGSVGLEAHFAGRVLRRLSREAIAAAPRSSAKTSRILKMDERSATSSGWTQRRTCRSCQALRHHFHGTALQGRRRKRRSRSSCPRSSRFAKYEPAEAREASVIAQHQKKEPVADNEPLGSCIARRRYGDTMVSFFTRSGHDRPPPSTFHSRACRPTSAARGCTISFTNEGWRSGPTAGMALGQSLHRTLGRFYAPDNRSGSLDRLMEIFDEEWVNEGFAIAGGNHRRL